MASFVMGIDEVGFGACAGPLVVGGAVMPAGWSHEKVKDSKSYHDTKKTKAHQKRQDVLAEFIGPAAVYLVTAQKTAEEVDELGLHRALYELMFAVKQLGLAAVPGTQVVIDGLPPPGWEHLFRECTFQTDADALVPAVSAASVLAKVRRDRVMIQLARTYPQYGFDQHKGYVTKEHKAAMKQYGQCPEHRRSYKKVQKFLQSR